jgi:cytochrome c oxidase assembly factor CtaG
VAAPLLALSRPLEAWSWALPDGARRVLAPLAAAWQRLSAPMVAWAVHAAALWVWHIPVLFGAALASIGLHVLQHACFFFSALLFWRAVFPRGVHDAGGAAIALVFTTMLHSSALGLLLTFAPGPWYAGYMAEGPAPFGLDALEDQQLGGLVMWVVGGFAYVVAGLAVVAAWLSPRRPQRRA